MKAESIRNGNPIKLPEEEMKEYNMLIAKYDYDMDINIQHQEAGEEGMYSSIETGVEELIYKKDIVIEEAMSMLGIPHYYYRTRVNDLNEVILDKDSEVQAAKFIMSAIKKCEIENISLNFENVRSEAGKYDSDTTITLTIVGKVGHHEKLEQFTKHIKNPLD